MEEKTLSERWLNWAIELQAIAQAGLAYSPNAFDKERFRRVRQIAAEMVSVKSGWPLSEVETVFCGEQGYPTPKLDTRAAIFEAGKILLVRERDGRWSLPGGWVDVTQSIGENAVKEVREEAGLEARALRLIAVQDRDRHNPPRYIYPICKIFVLCEGLGGAFTQNLETTESGYFALSEMPPLATEKCTRAQVEMCFAAAADPHWQAPFD